MLTEDDIMRGWCFWKSFKKSITFLAHKENDI